MNRRIAQLGFVLILVAMLTGLAIPFLANPRLGLAAHLAGLTGGLVLLAVAAFAPHFALGPRATAIMHAGWLWAAYGNWLACLLGGITGASRLTPIAGAATTGSAAAEAVVAALLQSVALATIAGATLAVWGLRPSTHLARNTVPAPDA